MDKCECWGNLLTWQYCNGASKICSCDGNKSKCDFYPEKRKESKMNTAEMWLKARENGKTYKLADVTRTVYYRDGKGLFDAKGYYVSIDHWCGIDTFMNEQWEEAIPVLTKSEAEAKFNIKIVGN